MLSVACSVAIKVDCLQVKRREKDIESVNVVHGEVNHEDVKWLSRSIIVESLKPIDVKFIEEWLPCIWNGCIRVREVGSFMVIVSFDSKEAMENVSHDEFDPVSSVFTKIRL